MSQPAATPPAVAPTGTATAQPVNKTTISAIQNRGDWQDCSAKNKSGFVCAAGMGEADAWMAQDRKTPSLSGSAAEFHIGGNVGYSNNLWWNQLGGNRDPSHFTYDFWLYSDHPELAQALEFDVNQSFDNTRWVFGTECNFNGTGTWDVWDASGEWGKWLPTKVGCARLSPGQWAHVIWNFERQGNQVHYISVIINGTEYPVDVWGAAQPNWSQEDINVAVQLDGNHSQQPYEVFVDKMSLTYW